MKTAAKLKSQNFHWRRSKHIADS